MTTSAPRRPPRSTPRSRRPGPAAAASSSDLKKHFPVRGGLLNRAVAKVQAVDGISFTVAKGETLGIVGESGCGKSTTARLLMHLIEPDAGAIVFDGDAVGAAQRHLGRTTLRRQVQMVFQDSYSSLNPRMTIGRHHRLRAAHARHRRARKRTSAPRTCSTQVGLEPAQLRAPLSARAVRRPAPARQHRPRAGAGAAAGDPRRGGLGARQVGRGAGAQPARRSEGASSTSPICSSATISTSSSISATASW